MNRVGVLFQSTTDGSSDHLSALPLEEIRARVLIVDVTAKVTLIQRFYNASPFPTGRAKYCFPVPASAAVCAFQMISSDGRTIKGECKEKSEARRQYELALASGREAGLLDHATDDIFVISIGTFPPHTVVETRVTYTMTLYTGDYTDQVQFGLPKHIGQRYGTPPPELENAMQPSRETTRISITLDIQMHGKIREIISSSHPNSISETKYSTHHGRSSKRRTTIRYHSSTYLDRDFTLTIFAEGLDKPRCFAEIRRDPRNRLPDTLALQLTMVPRHKLPPIPAQSYIFLVDRSGSMGGSRMDTAKNVMVMMLRMIPSTNSTFNIFSFGNQCESWCSESQRYSQRTLEDATTYSKRMKADLGGTEICAALKTVFATCHHDIPTVVFVLTDGDAYDVKACELEVNDFVSGSINPRRVFTLGIGESVSTAMCEGIANAGNGECLLARDSSSIVAQCAKLFTAGRTPFVRDVSVDWGLSTQGGTSRSPSVASSRAPSTGLITPVPDVQQAPRSIHSIHSGTRMSIYALISSKNIEVPQQVTLSGFLDDETRCPFQFDVDVQRTTLTDTDDQKIPIIHTMAAWKLIQEYGADYIPLPHSFGDATRVSVITQLGIQFQLATPYTSFVAIDGVRDTHSGQRLKTSFMKKHPEVSQDEQQQQNDDDFRSSPQPPPSHGLVDSLLTNLMTMTSNFRNFFSSFLTANPPVDLPIQNEPQEPPGSWPDEPEPSWPDTRSPPPSDFGSDSSSAGSFSTLSTLEPHSSDSEMSSIYSDYTDEEPDAPSPRLETLDLPTDRAKRSDEPPSQPPPTVPPSVVELVQFQNFDGSFVMNLDISRIVGTEVVEAGKQLKAREEQAIWTTICCVAYLKTHLHDNPEVLVNLLTKTMEFLHSKNVDVDKLIQHAISLLKS